MKKRIGLSIETQRAKPLSTLITEPTRKLEQDLFEATDPQGTIDPNETNAAAPSSIEIDPTSLPSPDEIGAGQSIYERLTLTSGEYCPTFAPSFYRRVWFDGLEALEPYHFTVDVDTGCAVPVATLPTGTIVTASYVKA